MIGVISARSRLRRGGTLLWLAVLIGSLAPAHASGDPPGTQKAARRAFAREVLSFHLRHAERGRPVTASVRLCRWHKPRRLRCRAEGAAGRRVSYAGRVRIHKSRCYLVARFRVRRNASGKQRWVRFRGGELLPRCGGGE